MASQSPEPKPPPRGSSLSDEAVSQRKAARAAAGARRTEAPPARPGRAPAGASRAGVAGFAAGQGAKAARSAGRARIPTGNRQYQGVIVAEFLVAVLIVALAPIARGKAAQDTSGGPSPYGVDDIKQLAGIGAVYFVLALLSSGKYGRLSAWLGGLILVAIGLAQTQSGGLAGIFGIFQPSSRSAGAGDGAGAAVGSSIAQGAGEAVAGLGFQPVPDATGIFPVVTPGGQVIPAGVVEPTPTGAPSFNQQVTQASTGGLVQAYTGGPGVVTTNTGTQLA